MWRALKAEFTYFLPWLLGGLGIAAFVSGLLIVLTVFVNDSDQPVGRGTSMRLYDGDRLRMGDYQLTWDGQDAGGSAVASGQYFARLRIGSEVMQVRKLSLVK